MWLYMGGRSIIIRKSPKFCDIAVARSSVSYLSVFIGVKASCMSTSAGESVRFFVYCCLIPTAIRVSKFIVGSAPLFR